MRILRIVLAGLILAGMQASAPTAVMALLTMTTKAGLSQQPEGR
jgi:hypothetical protein